MNVNNKKRILIALVAGVALGSGGTYGIMQAQSKPKTYQISDQQQANDNPLNGKSVQQDNTLPEGTKTPSEVTSKIAQYKDKAVILRGIIAESGKDQYSIVDQKAGGGFGLKLDFSKTQIKPTEFVGSASKAADLVTVKGQVTETKAPEGYVIYKLIVESVNK